MHAGEKNSSPRPQDTKNAGADKKKRARPSDGQTNMAGRAKLAAQLSPATGVQKSPGSRHLKEEVCHLSHEKLRGANYLAVKSLSNMVSGKQDTALPPEVRLN